MADEQKNFSGQVNALATRVAQEFKAVKASSGSGAKPWPTEWTSFDQATTEGVYYLTAANVAALDSESMPVDQAKSSDAILKVYKLDGENTFSQELYVSEKVVSSGQSRCVVTARKAYYRTLPHAAGRSNEYYVNISGFSYHNTANNKGGGLKGSWFPATGMMGNIGYAAGYTVPAEPYEQGFETFCSMTLLGGSACSYFDYSEEYACVDGLNIPNGEEGQSWVKYVASIKGTRSVTLGDRWSWVNGEAPTLGKGVIVAVWCHLMGVVSFIPAEAS